MTEFSVLYVVGWIIMLWIVSDGAIGKSWPWCVGSAFGCVLWPMMLIVDVSAEAAATKERTNKWKK